MISSVVPTNFPFVPGLNGKKKLVLSEWNSGQKCRSNTPPDAPYTIRPDLMTLKADPRRLDSRSSNVWPPTTPMPSLRSYLAGKYPTNGRLRAWQFDQPVAGFRQICLVPCNGPDCTRSVVPTKLCVIIHNFAHQPFDQLLTDRPVLAAC